MAGSQARSLGLRLRNLGIDRWQLWSRGRRDVDRDRGRGAQRRAVWWSISGRWRRSRRRRSRPRRFSRPSGGIDRTASRPSWSSTRRTTCARALRGDPVTAIATEHAARIAAEGRKYGLYLLVSTQRPQKVDEQVISQCDNLVLMRMNSRSDLAHVSEAFSFVPSAAPRPRHRLRPRRGARRRQDRVSSGARSLRRAASRRRAGRTCLRTGRGPRPSCARRRCRGGRREGSPSAPSHDERPRQAWPLASARSGTTPRTCPLRR